MSVYNGEKYLKEAIESILDQTFRDFEFIIVNDGSTDGTSDILAHYQQIDNRIRVYDQENRGLVTSLNRGCQLAKGEYIARMDADDISLPERFAKQVEFLNAHSEVGVLGTQMEQIDEKGKPFNAFHAPLDHEAIVWKMLFECSIAHPTVMMRKALLTEAGGYDPSYSHIEDTELWSRLIGVTRFANHPESLFLRRWHKQSICNLYADRQFQIGMVLRRRAFERVLDKEVSQEVLESLSHVLFYPQTVLKPYQIKQVVALMLDLYDAFVKDKQMARDDADAIRWDLIDRIMLVNQHNGYISPEDAKSYWKRIIPMPIRHIGGRLLALKQLRKK